MASPLGLIKESVSAFIEDGALSRGASIAFYSVTSLAPVLVIVVAIAGLAFGQDAAQGALTGELRDLMGQQSAELLQTAIANASNRQAGITGSLVGLVFLLITASGVFSEMQTALNAIWHAAPKGSTVSRMVRARAASLGLVAALGFLLLVSLVVNAGLSAVGDYLSARMPFNAALLYALNFAVSFFLIAVLFAAIYKVLPDTDIEWRDVAVGAVVTSLLFSVGKFLIGFYLGHSSTSSTYGAAGSLIVILLWIYYSAQIFLLGAEFTKAYAHRHGSRNQAALPPAPEPAPQPVPVAEPRSPEMFQLVGLLTVGLGVLALPFVGRRRRS